MFFFIAAAALTRAETESWFDRVWRTDEGLPDNGISGLAQSGDGFLWVGTQGGLMRFDGEQFCDFSTATLSNVPNHVVRSLTLDHRGRLWLGMDRGAVVCAEPDAVRIFSNQDGLPDSSASDMVEDNEGAIWIAYFSSTNITRIKDGEVRRFDTRHGLPLEGTWCWLATDAQGQLWFSRGGQIGVFRDGRFQTLLKLEGETARIARARDGGIWVCTETRLGKFKEGKRFEEICALPVGEIGPAILLEDHTGAVWIGADSASGLFRYDGGAIKPVKTSHPVVTCLMEDREGNIWAGTAGGGLNRLRSRVLELIDIGSGRSADSVRSTCEDATGALWGVSRDGFLMRQDGTNWVKMTSQPDWPGGRAACVTTDRKGAVWIGIRGNGLYKFENGRYTVWRKEQGFIGDMARSILASSRGDIWVGIDSPRQLLRLRDNQITRFDLPFAARSIRAMAEDATGDIWAATAAGLLVRVKDDTIEDISKTLPLVFSIRCLHATPDGSLWIGYADGRGMARLKDGHYSAFTAAEGLEENYVSQIIADRHGWLWLAGNRGLSRVQLQQMNDVAEGRAQQVRAITFGRGEGLPGLQATYDNYPSAFRGSDGDPRIATRAGLAIVHTENIRDNPESPPVVMESVAVDGKTQALYDSRSPLREESFTNISDLRKLPETRLQLPPGHRKIEFEFTAPSLTAPENVQFSYRLEGLDKDWTKGSTERSAIYTRLAAGDYKFHVIACNHSGVWNREGATLAFTVLPFFWETWWFRLAMLAAFTGLVIATVRYVSFRRLRYKLQLLEQQARLDKERTRIARDLHDDLGGSLTQVALMLDLPEENASSPEKTREYLRDCSRLVRQVVKSVDGIIWAINPRNDTLRYLMDYISEFAVEFLQAADISCRIEMPDEFSERSVSPEVRHHLFLVVKEALNNIVCHARAREVQLRITATDNEIRITIADNGCGFERATDSPRSNGLRNMRQRMEEIGGQFLLESKPNEGTTISFIYTWPAQARP